MNAIRLRRRIDSDTLHLPELNELLGKTVEIIILDETPGPSRSLGASGCFTARSPREAFAPNALEAMRGQLTREQYEALYTIASQDLLDVDAIVKLRAASMI